MRYEITYARSALKTLRKIDRKTAQRILRAIDALASDPHPLGCKQLKGGSGEMRIRIGDYRVVYDVIDAEVVVLVLRIGHRREVYR
ncbi:type II toxin-antitoxin system RelE family toxin [Leucobacter denitrificans]|uniref:Type II toxin-antitoxin system RelE/ParE family toxin n=1 Tax=Leucobacter denitrificans TaxID=683042 RepID=A0A7G9S576_9MICO|nr:type II toxin-antitoxin system RelE/ParE family toxin [Leucobacter denitrificans]QNN63001.1 type II toxin-antitoxin system RelE/ParE family toxin [Leucobacter denitrificans]